MQKLKANLRYVLIFVVLLAAANAWQSRHMPRGQAPHSYVTGLDGEKSFELPAKDNRVELIYFFAPWCGVCALSAPNAMKMAEWFPDLRVRFVALDYEQVSEVLEFAKQNLKGEVYLGNATVKENWAVSAYPSYAIVDPSGNISHVSVGYSTILGMAFHVVWAKFGV